MNIFESITKIMEDVPAIEKNKTNTQQNFKFRGIDDVMNALQPLLAKYKVFIVPEIIEQIREERKSSKGATLIYSICKIKYTFYAQDGTSVQAITIGEGMDSGDKATNKAMAIAMKYALFQVFCIPTEDMSEPDEESLQDLDSQEWQVTEQIKNNSNNTNTITEVESKSIYDLMTRKGLNVEKALQENYGITETSKLNKEQYSSIIRFCNDLPDKKV